MAHTLFCTQPLVWWNYCDLFGEAYFAAGVTCAGYAALAAAAAGFLWPSLPGFGALGAFAMANVAF